MSVFIGVILVAFTALAWRDLKLALTMIIALSPAYLVRFELGIPSTVLEGMIVIAFASWIITSLRHGQGRALPLRAIFASYGPPIFFLLAVATFATLWAPSLTTALGIWKAYFIEPVFVLIMLRTTFVAREDWTRALTGLALTTMAIAAFAIFQRLTGLGLPIPWDVDRRATSIFEYPNAVGLFIAPIVSALCVMRPRVALIAVPLGLAAIVLSETEAALVAIPAALWVAFLLSNQSLTKKITLTLLCLGVGLSLLVGVSTIRQKILLDDYSGGVRRSQWTETVEMLKDRPLQGAGLAGYPTVFVPYHDPKLYEIFQYPHNVILNFWVEMGLFGVIAFLWLALVTGKLAWQRRTDPLVLTAFAALLTMTIHGLVDVPFFKNDLAVLTAFFMAMMLTYNHPEKIAN